jgi:TPP-dependent pyruvate/acetoin dehydrogenase alpha subunit
MATPHVSSETQVDLYRLMQLIRRAEEMLIDEYHPADEMRCPIHFCVGQEAMPAALSKVLRPSDVMASHYRSHGYYLAKGGSLRAMVAEFYGKATGANGGLAGSMELGAPDLNFSSGAIVGGSVLVPLGSAFAQKYRGRDEISVAVLGDGALDEGVVYEVLNLAVLHRLPLLFVCENNGYAAHTPLERRAAVPALGTRVRAFGLPVLTLDGNDAVLLLQELIAIEPTLRSGGGPVFVEIETYRYCAHVGPGDDRALAYRPDEEIARWRARDPIVRLRRTLTEGGVDPGALDTLDRAVEEEVAAAIAAAKAAPFPSLDDALAANWAGTYSPVVTRLITDVTREFKGGQAETRPAPY